MFDTTTQQRILNAWRTNNKREIGHWEAVTEGGKEYVAHAMIDILKLYFENKIDRLITFNDLNAADSNLSNIDFSKIRIANTYSEKIEESPSIVVRVQDIVTTVGQIGWRTDENQNEFLECVSIGGVALTIEGRDSKECEILADRLDRGVLAFIAPGLGMLDAQILVNRTVALSDLRERVVNSQFKPMQRTLSLRFRLDCIPIAWIVDEPVMTSVETGATQV